MMHKSGSDLFQKQLSHRAGGMCTARSVMPSFACELRSHTLEP